MKNSKESKEEELVVQ